MNGVQLRGAKALNAGPSVRDRIRARCMMLSLERHVSADINHYLDTHPLNEQTAEKIRRIVMAHLEEEKRQGKLSDYRIEQDGKTTNAQIMSKYTENPIQVSFEMREDRGG